MQLLATTKIPLTKTDSLKQTIHFLEQRIDSLAKHTQINEIGQNFFSDAISRDLYMFSTIVVIAGLVSWGWVELRLIKQRSFIKNKINKTLKAIEVNNVAQQDKVSSILFNVNRAMYGVSNANNFHFTTLKWAIKALISMIELYSVVKVSEVSKWLKIIKQTLDKVAESDFKKLKLEVGEFHKNITILKAFDPSNQQLSDQIDAIELLYMTKAYTDVTV